MPQKSRASFVAVAVIVAAIAGVYWNSLSAPFLFDDTLAIEQNNSIRQLWPLSHVFSPPSDGSGVTGRPIVNLSLALNYAWSGLNVTSYHVVNLVIHALAAAALFGLVRRSLLRPALRGRFTADAAWWIATAVALLWALHPLQTETVTCVVQRTEALVALFYLLTLYLFVRGVEASEPRAWHAAALVACMLGMASKEVMASAPLVVLLFDRTFFAGSFFR